MTDNWRPKAAALAATGVISWRQIADIVGVPKSTVSDFLRGVDFEDGGGGAEILPPLKAETEPHDNARILLISDMHIPYHHKKLIPFLKGLKKKYSPTRIICLGDELDKHAMSFHDSDPDLDSAGTELEKSLPVIAELHELFPKMDLIESNHGSMVFRKAKHHGISRRYVRSYNEVLEVDNGWQWHDDLTIQLPDGQWVYFHHGKTVEAVRTSQLMGMSHVCGHYHEAFGVKYWANPRGLYWGMNAGCLIDNKALAFAYNRTNPKRPIIGTGLIIDGVPVMEAMPL